MLTDQNGEIKGAVCVDPEGQEVAIYAGKKRLYVPAVFSGNKEMIQKILSEF